MQTAKTTTTPTAPSPWCTIYDCPFATGQAVSWTGLGGSVACKAAGLVSGPYATIAAIFFGVMSVVTCFGQYRSRQNYLAEEKLVTDITAQGTEMKSRAHQLGATADALTSVDESWKQRAQNLEQEKGILEKAKDALQKVCDTLRQENEQLKANASSAAKGAQEDDAQVRLLGAETSSLAKDLNAGVASQKKLDQEVGEISGGLSDFKQQSSILETGIQRVTDLVNVLRPSNGAMNAGQDAERTAASLDALTKRAQHEADAIV